MEQKERAIVHAQNASKALVSAYEKARQDLIDIIKEMGGIIRTAPSSDKPTLYCFYDDGCPNAYNSTNSIPVQAIAFDEGEGLMVLTNEELQNYEYDEDYTFEYFYDYEGDDERRYEDATKDLTYFRCLDDGYTVVNETISSILIGLADYLA